MLNELQFLDALKAAIINGKYNFVKQETEKLINTWQLKILDAANKGNKSVDIFLGDSEPPQVYLDGAFKFFKECRLQLSYYTNNTPKNHTHYYVSITWN